MYQLAEHIFYEDHLMKSSKSPLTISLVLAWVVLTLSLAVCAQAQTLNYFADFNGGNGWEPYSSVTQATDGNFYGTATNGIYGGGGNIFRMTPAGNITSIYKFCSQTNCADGAGPAGRAGKSVIILGYGLTGTTDVLFNGVQANFTVESDTYIKATIPVGATTGKVSVMTSSGTLSSSQFLVTK
jgi:uncharacterized repeat protein (TIGR03803 family)